MSAAAPASPPGPATPAGHQSTYRTGIVLCVLSGLSFGLLGAFGTLAFGGGQSVSEVLLLRFGTAAGVLWAVVLLTRRRIPTGRALVQGIALGAVGYALQSLLYFSALQRLSVGLTSLLLYTFPVLVVVVSLLLGRERPSWRAPVAALLAVGGVAACLVSGDVGLDVVGILLGLGSAVVYTGYYFGMDTLPVDTDRLGSGGHHQVGPAPGWVAKATGVRSTIKIIAPVVSSRQRSIRGLAGGQPLWSVGEVSGPHRTDVDHDQLAAARSRPAVLDSAVIDMASIGSATGSHTRIAPTVRLAQA